MQMKSTTQRYPLFRKFFILTGYMLYCSVSSLAAVNFYYTPSDQDDSMKLRAMEFALSHIPGHTLHSIQAPMRRINTILSKPQDSGIHCSIDPFSIRDDHMNENAKWSKVIALNPGEWVIVYNKNALSKMKPYITNDGYLSDNVSHLPFTTADLFSPWLAVFRDPKLQAGYAYDFATDVPADIISKTHMIRSIQGQHNILRMIDKGRLDVTATQLSSLEKAVEQWQLSNLAHLRLEFTRRGSQFDNPFFQYGLRCASNPESDRFLALFNKVLNSHRGTASFVHALMDGFFSTASIENTLAFSQQLQNGHYDKIKIKLGDQCTVLNITIDQTQNGARWNVIADLRDPKAVIIRGDGKGYTVADAVKFVPLTETKQPLKHIIIDDADADFSQSGMGFISDKSPGGFNGSYRHDTSARSSAGKWSKWASDALPPGDYQIFMWWPHSQSQIYARVANAPVEIAYGKNCKVDTDAAD